MTVNSVVLIVPETHAAAMNALGQALGYGTEVFSRQLSANGAAPATHTGTHVWEAPGGTFFDLRSAVQNGQTPPGLEPYAAALQATVIRVVEASLDAQANWAAALDDLGLAQVVAPSL